MRQNLQNCLPTLTLPSTSNHFDKRTSCAQLHKGNTFQLWAQSTRNNISNMFHKKHQPSKLYRLPTPTLSRKLYAFRSPPKWSGPTIFSTFQYNIRPPKLNRLPIPTLSRKLCTFRVYKPSNVEKMVGAEGPDHFFNIRLQNS